MKELYIIRKFVFANSIEETIKKDRKAKVNECWLDEESRKQRIYKSIDDTHNDKELKNIGFKK